MCYKVSINHTCESVGIIVFSDISGGKTESVINTGK